MLPQGGGGMCFCRLARPSQSFSLSKQSKLAKTMTPIEGVPAAAGQPALQLQICLFKHKVVAVPKAIAYTDLLCSRAMLILLPGDYRYYPTKQSTQYYCH
jgi:hypothetical protein